MYSFWAEQWARQDFHSESHNIKVKRSKWPCSAPALCQIYMPWKYEAVTDYSFWLMAQTKLSWRRPYFQGQMSKGQNNFTAHRFHVKLICFENMKLLSYIVFEQWPRHTLTDRQRTDRQIQQAMKIPLSQVCQAVKWPRQNMPPPIPTNIKWLTLIMLYGEQWDYFSF